METSKEVEFVLKKLNDAGYNTYIVGGAIRDYLLGGEILDYDLASSAKVNEIINLFPNYKSYIVNEEAATVILFINGSKVEISSFRIEKNYKKNGLPSSIIYVDSIYRDLSRRDFTINSLIYNQKEGFIDYFNSIEDFKNKKIKTIGNSDIKIEEDPLRILRAIRFSGQYNFNLDKSLKDSIKSKNYNIKYLSNYKINRELKKIFNLKYFNKALTYLLKFNIFTILIKEKYGIQNYSKVYLHKVENYIKQSIDSFNYEGKSLDVRYILIIYNIYLANINILGREDIAIYLKNIDLILSIAEVNPKKRNRIKKSIDLVKSLEPNTSKKYLKRLLNRYGVEIVEDSLEARIILSKTLNKNLNEVRLYIEMQKRLKEIIEYREVYDLKDLDIDGNDLIDLGINEGKEIGYILLKVLDLVMENKLKNKKENIIQYIERMIK